MWGGKEGKLNCLSKVIKFLFCYYFRFYRERQKVLGFGVFLRNYYNSEVFLRDFQFLFLLKFVFFQGDILSCLIGCVYF